jgi:hypothetical protein
MAFKLTYRDGQSDDYDDGTEWEVDAGVLKLGREVGNWTVLVSPSHWATIEVQDKDSKRDDDSEKKRDKKDKDDDKDKHDSDDDDDDDDDDKDDDEKKDNDD